MHPMLLVHAASNINNVINFIEGVSFRDALSAIGDNEVEAALLAMQNAKKAHDVKREVESAVNHLQSAHIAYCSVWQQIRGSDFSKWTRGASQDWATLKDAYVSCLMALCYIYLGEFHLAQDCAAFAKEAKRVYNWDTELSTGENTLWFVGSLLREPGKVFSLIKESLAEDSNIKALDVDVEAFSKAIEQYR